MPLLSFWIYFWHGYFVPLTEDARVKGFALNGEGKLETVAAKISYICDGDSAEKIICPEDKISEAVDLKWA